MLRIAPDAPPQTVICIEHVPTRLLITEITRMGEAFCVIGLQTDGDRIHSLRPVLSGGWKQFRHRRGDVIEFSLLPTPGEPPHVEDRRSTRDLRRRGSVDEPDVVNYLRKAECADCLRDLFECSIYANERGSGAYALPREARRSISGFETQNLGLKLLGNKLQNGVEKPVVRAAVGLPSGEVLQDLPVVDRDWLDFIDAALAETRGANRPARLERFLKLKFHYKVMSCPHHFARIGLTRRYREQGNACWLMLDTLFPLPKTEWLEEF